MCGLIGYTGNELAARVLSSALIRLEYRGYDSVGVAILDGGVIHLAKDKGKLSDFISQGHLETLTGHIGIGHTRWATHGKVTRENAHPHCDDRKQIAVVHNGIVENHLELRERLSKKYQFVSETDSEVIPHLIREYIESGLSFEQAVFAATKELQGSYSILAVSTLEPDKIIAARKESSLVIGLGPNGNYVGSDVLSVTRLQWEWQDSSRDNYEYYMLKEIEEQPEAIRKSIIQNSKMINRMANEILRARQVVFVACGSSRYAALIGRYAFSRIGHTFSDVILGSEFGYFSESVDQRTLVIALSQSGETADVLDGVKKAKTNGATVFSLVNVVDSSLARMSNEVLYLNCGPEIGVAATKSFMAELCVLYLLAFAMNGMLDKGRKMLREVSDLVELNLPYHTSVIVDIANKLKAKKDFYFLARGINFAMAGEGALKMKEISYVHAEGMPAGELKHGTLALIEKETPIVVICPTDYTYTDTMTNIIEAKVRGGHIIGISDLKDTYFDDWINIPKVTEVLYPLVTAVPLQLLAYYSALVRGLDPDKPRNLAKSVTVK